MYKHSTKAMEGEGAETEAGLYAIVCTTLKLYNEDMQVLFTGC